MSLKHYWLLGLVGAVGFGQVSDNASLSGKYYFRQVLLITDGSTAVNVTSTLSGTGTLVFDGKGNFMVTGQQLIGTAAPSALSGNGTYSVLPGGFVTLSNPLRQGATVNARLGTGALVGSSTEAGPGVYDLFLAIPSPSQPTSTATLNGAYWISSLEFPNGGVADIRDTNFKLTANGAGSFAETTITGQAANLNNHLQNQTAGPITYTLAGDGSGTLTFPLAAGLDSTTQLISGVKNIDVSSDGSYFIGGSMAAGMHGLVVGVKAFGGGASNSSWNGSYYAAGMRYDTSNPRLAAVSGAVHATGDGNSIWSRRTRQSDGLFDASPLLTYGLGADGSGTYTSTQGHVTLASSSQVFATSGVDVADSLSYEIYFGALMPPQSGSGVFLNPQGVFNSGSYSPAGYPVAPGEFITMFGTGFGSQSAVAKLPFPNMLAGVQVIINGISAPVYAVSPSQISAIVPYAVTGATATLVVAVNHAISNVVTLPLAATAPGVFSLAKNGLGDGAILHPDGTVVSSSAPATRGEYVSVYLSGLGATKPAVNDGMAAPSSEPFARITGPVNVFIEGQTANVAFAGLAPGFAGLYQLNVQIPVTVDSGEQSLAIQTNEGFTDLVNIFID